MRAYLLTWNPGIKHFWKDMQEILNNREIDWSCGNRKDMPKGSRVFVLRQGAEPRGIIASGFTTSEVYSQRHWIPERASRGDMANYVDVRLDTVREPDDVLPRSILDQGVFKSVYWDTPASGIEIPSEAAKALERLWKGNGSQRVTSAKARVQAVENTLTEARRYIRQRDRKLRMTALAAARGICAGCRRNYGEFLNGLGIRVLQVHHLKQMSASDAPRITTAKDLAVVCANCHTLIHADPKQAMPVATLRRRLSEA